jgi:Helix-turn-helix domain
VSLLESLLTDEVLAALDARYDARIAAALAARDREPAKRWLTAAETGDHLGISTRAVYERKRTGRIPADAIRYVGSRLMFDRQALDRALEQSC